MPPRTAGTHGARPARLPRRRPGGQPGRRRPAPQAAFLSMVAHELNTPLTPMRLQLQLLESGTLGGLATRQKDALRVLHRSLDRLHGLVQELLDVGRLEAGGLRTRAAKFDVAEAVAEAVESYEETARRLGIRLDVSNGGKALEAVADRDRVLQVLHNLLSNALKFTPEGGRVAVRLSRKAGHIEAAVADTGPGLSGQQLAELFQPFSRPLEASHPEAKGTGLGLYISKGLTEAMGGSLTAESAGAGKGATFILALPTKGHGAAPATARGDDEIARRLREIM